MRGDSIAVAAIVATIAFAVYTRTLLPGVDLGDTASFQATVLRAGTSARDAYPLYYAAAAPIVAAISPDDPARGLNLFSAVWGGIAAGLLAWLVATITRVTAAGVVAGLLLAFAYTFWTQAVIAEVYTLHLSLIGACLVALHAYASRPTHVRLALFCAIYALGFGNHLSMILWFLPCAAFVLLAHPAPRALVTPRTVAMALAIAAAGALQYAPNVLAAWQAVEAPESWTERLALAWMDITKGDWRDTMVLGIHPSAIVGRLAMWVWDARQQFGLPGIAAAVLGAIYLWRISRPWATLAWLAYAITAAFAITYNVGDVHVFFLPSHYLIAFAAGVGAAAPVHAWRHMNVRVPAHRWRMAAPHGVTVLMIGYAIWRGVDTWPAASRQDDRRADLLFARLTGGVDEQSALLVAALPWDQENVLGYGARYMHRGLAWVRLADVRPHFHHLVRDNHRIGRDVVLTARAAARVVAAYDGRFPLVEDTIAAATLADAVRAIPRGTPYVLTVLAPLDNYPLDRDALAGTIHALTNGHAGLRGDAAYGAIAGLSGEAPALVREDRRPFRTSVALLGEPFTIRMDAWLPTDTFRRGGFGHVIRGRQRVLYVERGASLVWFRPDGTPEVAYAGNPYAPQPRFRIPVVRTQVAAR